jgi:hypothetical protein
MSIIVTSQKRTRKFSTHNEFRRNLSNTGPGTGLVGAQPGGAGSSPAARYTARFRRLCTGSPVCGPVSSDLYRLTGARAGIGLFYASLRVFAQFSFFHDVHYAHLYVLLAPVDLSSDLCLDFMVSLCIRFCFR